LLDHACDPDYPNIQGNLGECIKHFVQKNAENTDECEEEAVADSSNACQAIGRSVRLSIMSMPVGAIKCLKRFALDEEEENPGDPLANDPDAQLVTYLFKEHAWGSLLWFLTSCSEPERQDAVALFIRIIARIQGLAADQSDCAEVKADVGVEMIEKNENPLAHDMEGLELKQDLAPEPVITSAVETVDDIIDKYFARFDLDGSGTLNGKDELDQLTSHLVFKLAQLNYPVSVHLVPPDDLIIESPLGAFEPRNLTQMLANLPELNDENSWTLEDFKTWFAASVWAEPELDAASHRIDFNPESLANSGGQLHMLP